MSLTPARGMYSSHKIGASTPPHPPHTRARFSLPARHASNHGHSSNRYGITPSDVAECEHGHSPMPPLGRGTIRPVPQSSRDVADDPPILSISAAASQRKLEHLSITPPEQTSDECEPYAMGKTEKGVDVAPRLLLSSSSLLPPASESGDSEYEKGEGVEFTRNKIFSASSWSLSMRKRKDSLVRVKNAIRAVTGLSLSRRRTKAMGPISGPVLQEGEMPRASSNWNNPAARYPPSSFPSVSPPPPMPPMPPMPAEYVRTRKVADAHGHAHTQSAYAALTPHHTKPSSTHGQAGHTDDPHMEKGWRRNSATTPVHSQSGHSDHSQRSISGGCSSNGHARSQNGHSHSQGSHNVRRKPVPTLLHDDAELQRPPRPPPTQQHSAFQLQQTSFQIQRPFVHHHKHQPSQRQHPPCHFEVTPSTPMPAGGGAGLSRVRSAPYRPTDRQQEVIDEEPRSAPSTTTTFDRPAVVATPLPPPPRRRR